MNEERYFLMQIKHTSNTWEKGVVVKDNIGSAMQSYHAYLGAYGYAHDPNTDYVFCAVFNDGGAMVDSVVDDRRSAVQEA